MVHIMLPFLILPLYANMRTIDKDCLKAAANLGATPTRAFWTVFFPLSLPGLFAGLLIVFVLCLGFYVTPALLGGGKVIMAAMKISDNIELYFQLGSSKCTWCSAFSGNNDYTVYCLQAYFYRSIRQ